MTYSKLTNPAAAREKFAATYCKISKAVYVLIKAAQSLLNEPSATALDRAQELLVAHTTITAELYAIERSCFSVAEGTKEARDCDDGGVEFASYLLEGWQRHTRELETIGHRVELALLEAQDGPNAAQLRRLKKRLQMSNSRLVHEVQGGSQEVLGVTARGLVLRAQATAEEREERARKAAITRADTKDSRERDAELAQALAAESRAQEPKRGLVHYQRAVRERTCHKAVWDDVLPLVLAASNEVYTGDLFEDYRVIVSPQGVSPRVWLGVTGASRLEGCHLISFKLLEYAKTELLRRHTLQEHKGGFTERETCLLVELDVKDLRSRWELDGRRGDEVYAHVKRDFAAFAGVLIQARIGNYERSFQFVTEPELKNGILQFWVGHNYAELLRRGDGKGNYRNPQIVTYPNRIYAVPTKAEFMLLQAMCRVQDSHRRAAGLTRARSATQYARSRVSLLIRHINARTGEDWERERMEGYTRSHKTWREMAQSPFEGVLKRLITGGFLDFARYVADDGHGRKAELPLGTRFKRARSFDNAMLEFSVAYLPTELAAFTREKRRRKRRTDVKQAVLGLEGSPVATEPQA